MTTLAQADESVALAIPESDTCVRDPRRSCGACSAAKPAYCPYRYLLDEARN